MELLVFVLIILTIGLMIGISMISFKIAITSLIRLNELEGKINKTKTYKLK